MSNVGFVSGCFDCLHSGHIALITRAAQLCDRLIVGINSDDIIKQYKNIYPFDSENERKLIVESIKGVSAVVINETSDKFEIWKKLKFNTIFVGDDWYGTEKWNEWEEKLSGVGVKVVYLSRTKNISSTEKKKHAVKSSCNDNEILICIPEKYTHLIDKFKTLIEEDDGPLIVIEKV